MKGDAGPLHGGAGGIWQDTGSDLFLVQTREQGLEEWSDSLETSQLLTGRAGLGF